MRKIARPGQHSFPVWAAWFLERGPSGHRSLAMRTDQRVQNFSEFLVVDLETEQHTGVVFENMGEIWWGCLHQRPGTGDYFGLLPKDMYHLDWAHGRAQALNTGGFPGGLPAVGQWQGSNTLWVVTLGQNPTLFEINFEPRIRVRAAASLRPPEKKVGLDYRPSELRVSKGGKIWVTMGPGQVVLCFDPVGNEVQFLRNLAAKDSIRELRFLDDAVVIGGAAFDLETARACELTPAMREELRFRPWFDKWLDDAGKLYTPLPGKDKPVFWGMKPPDHMTPPPPNDPRWDPGLFWHGIHGEYAYGTSRQYSPRIGLVSFHGPTGKLSLREIPWKPSRPQQLYSMHVGPDGCIYGSNYDLVLWRVNPALGRCDSLGWAVPPRAGGEIWAFANRGKEIYFASYTHSWLSVYDPAKPWRPGVEKDCNPRNLFRLHDHILDQHRPRAVAAGSDGLVYMASCADYGTSAEGALAGYNPESDQIEVQVHPLVPDHQLCSLAAPPTRRELFVGTYTGGLHGQSTGGALVVWDLDQRKVVRTFDLPRMVSFLAATDDFVMGTVFGEWKVFFYDPRTGQFTPPALLGGRRTFFVGNRPSGGTFLLHQEGHAYDFDPRTQTLTEISPPGAFINGSYLQEGKDGEIYYLHADLYDIEGFMPQNGHATQP